MIVALVVAGAIIAFVFVVDKESRSDTSDWGNRLRVISGVVLAGFVVAYFFFPEQFEAAAHWVAAVLIFVIIGAVVFINAYLVGNQDKQDPGDAGTLQTRGGERGSARRRKSARSKRRRSPAVGCPITAHIGTDPLSMTKTNAMIAPATARATITAPKLFAITCNFSAAVGTWRQPGPAWEC